MWASLEGHGLLECSAASKSRRMQLLMQWTHSGGGTFINSRLDAIAQRAVSVGKSSQDSVLLAVRTQLNPDSVAQGFSNSVVH